jgi:anti-sigma factor RsiW
MNGIDPPCPSREPRLAALLDGELSATEQAGMADHLRRCPGCGGELARQRAARRALAAVRAQLRAPLHLRARVRADLDRAAQPAPRRRRVAAIAGLAAVLVLCAAVAAVWTGRAEPGSELVDRAIAAHRTTTLTGAPVTLASDDAEAVTAWLRASGRPLDAPVFAVEGYRLLGARREPSVEPGAVSLVYEGPAGRLTCTIIVGRLAPGRGFAVSAVSPTVFSTERQGVSVAAWMDADTTYLLIGAVDPLLLQRLAVVAEQQDQG